MKILCGVVLTLLCYLQPVQLQYDEGCGGVFHGHYGEITSPGYPASYPDDMLCVYYISRPDVGPIFVNFKAFDVEAHHECTYDFVKVYDGPSQNSTHLATFCGTTALPLTTTGNKMTVVFSSDPSRSYRGFRMLYGGPFQDKCGQDLFGDRGAIASPNYPNKYPDNINCVYKITRPHGQVALSFLDFEMESHGTCKFDHISVHNGPDTTAEVLAVHCGDGAREVLASGSVMTILFHSDISKNFSGFWAHWGGVDCAFMGGFCSTTGCRYSGNYSCPGTGTSCCLDSCNLYQNKICPDESCINRFSECDRNAHPSPGGIHCPEHGHICPDDSCISDDYLCPCSRHDKRCWDGSCVLAEAACPCNGTSPHQCMAGDECYSDQQWCNGQGECSDWSDEMNCSENPLNDSGSTWIFILIAMFAIIICICIVIASVRRQYNHRRALAAARRRMQTAITEMSREDGRHVYDNPIMDSPPAYGIAVNSQYPEAPPPSYECSIPQTTPGTPQVYPPESPPAYDSVSHITSGYIFVDGMVVPKSMVVPKPDDASTLPGGIILMAPITQPLPPQPPTGAARYDSPHSTTETLHETPFNGSEPSGEEESEFVSSVNHSDPPEEESGEFVSLQTMRAEPPQPNTAQADDVDTPNNQNAHDQQTSGSQNADDQGTSGGQIVGDRYPSGGQNGEPSLEYISLGDNLYDEVII